jgi:uncharacterized protein YbjT (DUF2867 family)
LPHTVPRNIIILGATGAVGTEVVRTLSGRAEVTVTALTRRPLTENFNTNVTTHIVDPLDSKSYSEILRGHQIAICTLGVGQPTKVSKEEFKRVDFDAVLAFATTCRNAGVEHFLLLGSVAASPNSSSHYLQSKGRLRDAIAALGFKRFSTFQPSVLLTKTNRYDWKQGVLLIVWPLISPLLLGPLSKYRGIRVEDLGHAIASRAIVEGQGVEILHWSDFTSNNVTTGR